MTVLYFSCWSYILRTIFHLTPCFYLKYIVLYELINNPTPNFKYPMLVSIIEEKYMKIFVDILHFWHCLANAIKESYICKFDIRIRALIKVCNMLHGIMNEQGNSLGSKR